MKLQAKYTRVTLVTAALVLMLGSIGYYYLLKGILLRPIDEALRVEEEEILDHVAKYHQLPEATYYDDQQITFKKTDKQVRRTLRTTNVYNLKEKDREISRQLIFPVAANGTLYTASVTKSQLEAEDLLLLILCVTGAVLFLLFAVIFLVNRFFMQRLWTPFFHSLTAMKHFNLSSSDIAMLSPSKIDEFNALNTELKLMMEHVRSDYNLIRTFADNASHEMQTPLAVINSKLDLLIQDSGLKENNAETIAVIYQSINKLTLINKSLLLLAKIENRQFSEMQSVNVATVVNEKIHEIDDILHGKNVGIETDLQSLTVTADRFLFETLISNLLINAVRHNVAGGWIQINTFFKGIEVRNTSDKPGLNPGAMYNRFQKDAASEGLGLGLAIVKQICDVYGYTIHYTFENKVHAFKIRFA